MRVYLAASDLYNAGNDTITATQIYKAMGYNSNPTSEQLRKIFDSLTKMGSARLYIDNAQEAQAYKKYTHFQYDAPLLPFERKTVCFYNTATDFAIHLFREPPLITFAKERKQITCLPKGLLKSPISKTNSNLRIENYLIERIGHMKSPKSRTPKKMLYKTIFDNCGITESKQKQRAIKIISRILDYHKEKNWIQGYKTDKEGVTIELKIK